MKAPSPKNDDGKSLLLKHDEHAAADEPLLRRITVTLTSEEEAEKLQKRITQSSPGMAVAGEHVMELELEEFEWDGSTPFYMHCIAGSLAGVAEHLLMYPFDTLKTQIQSYTAATAAVDASRGASATTAAGTSTAEANSSMLSALRHHFYASGESGAAAFVRLWRGVQAMAIGCIPAHAMYFSTYEVAKEFFLARQEGDSKNLGAFGSSVAGSVAALSHDAVMVPADTIKQRLQLGYYKGVTDAFRTMVRQEGAAGLYRALPVTLCTNLPYGAVMVATNEHLREMLMKQTNAKTLDVQTTLLAGCGAGMTAAAVTTPLDRLKTRLQTQGLGIVQHDVIGSSTPKAMAPKYNGLKDAFLSIVKEEGYRGLFRGLPPRILTHAPSVAVSWTVYEVMKQVLLE